MGWTRKRCRNTLHELHTERLLNLTFSELYSYMRTFLKSTLRGMASNYVIITYIHVASLLLKYKLIFSFLSNYKLKRTVHFCRPNGLHQKKQKDCLANTKLTYCSPVLLFYTPENIRKPKGFLMFSGGIKSNTELQWDKLGN